MATTSPSKWSPHSSGLIISLCNYYFVLSSSLSVALIESTSGPSVAAFFLLLAILPVTVAAATDTADQSHILLLVLSPVTVGSAKGISTSISSSSSSSTTPNGTSSSSSSSVTVVSSESESSSTPGANGMSISTFSSSSASLSLVLVDSLADSDSLVLKLSEAYSLADIDSL